MNRNFRTSILTVAAIMALGTTCICFAANNSKTTSRPNPVKAAKATTNTAGKVPQKARNHITLKVNKAKAIKIALKAHPGATIASIKIDRKAYMINLTSQAGNYTMRIGGNTGRIIRNVPTFTKAATTGASAEPATTATPTASK